MFERQASTGGKSSAKHSSANTARPAPSALHRGAALQNSLGNRGTLAMLQAKLRSGRPNDPFEQEADHVADLVMRTPSAGSEFTSNYGANSTDAPVIQRKCNACQDERKDEMLAAKSDVGVPGTVSDDLESRIEGVRAGGEPLSRE